MFLLVYYEIMIDTKTKLPEIAKIVENCRKLSKIAGNCRKLLKLPGIAEIAENNCQKFPEIGICQQLPFSGIAGNFQQDSKFGLVLYIF